MKRPTLGAIAGALTKKAAKPATRTAKDLALELARWKLTIDVSIPLGSPSQAEVREFSARLKKASKTPEK